MNIVLVQCPAWQLHSPPYGLAILGSVLKKQGHAVTYFDINIELYYQRTRCSGLPSWDDANFEKDCNEFNVASFFENNQSLIETYIAKILLDSPAVVAFSVQKTSVLFSLTLAKKIKNKCPELVIVFGGPECSRFSGGVTLFSNNLFIDIVSLCEAEHTIAPLCDLIQGKQYHQKIPGYLTRTMDGVIIDGGEFFNRSAHIAFADYSAFDLSKYCLKILPIITSRGCINKCTFCVEHSIGGPYRKRAWQDVISEIAFQVDKYPNQFHSIWFTDSLMNGDMQHLQLICDGLRDNKLPWFSEFLIRRELSLDLLKRMRESGCVNLVYGMESGSTRVLRDMGKRYLKQTALRVVRDTAQAGISVHLNFIVGFPSEGIGEFIETIVTISRMKRYINTMSFFLCAIPKDSALFRNKESLGLRVSAKDSVDWCTVDGANTFIIRQERLEILNQLFLVDSKTSHWDWVLRAIVRHMVTILLSRIRYVLFERMVWS